ncbi:hypothetical protein B0O80DRAFT_453557 [Mortierella sp. GBAus27b]|nr:hypothetical protein B0O80DRAFT_453557 [Mortierella sp. GBAus27b]
MVRFKNRYLLFEIVYADTPLGWTSIPATTIQEAETSDQSGGPQRNPFGDTGRKNCRLPPLSSKDLLYAIKESITENFGDYGAGTTQRPLSLKYFSPYTSIGILRISREETHTAWGALTLIRELKGKPCIIKILHTSGTIRNCQLMTIKYDRDRIMFLRSQAQLLNDTQALKSLTFAIEESTDEINSLDL